ncbi:MAG: GNAT family N-acetyltransferase [Alphaproteobacteria bacterium]|jgi:ribosomal protein S18 acetylase RimI-like enzyme|nr:GNAT family N-acetyltransferase [Alphaproteobacteria bacterium]
MVTLRQAGIEDVAGIEALVRAAYSIYLPRIGKPPGPMLDDYHALVADGRVTVVDHAGRPAGLIVLLPQPDHLLLDNVAVAPEAQGRGLGRRLIAFAEAEARRLGLHEIRLYTHITMTENITLYRRLGFVETHRGEQAGYSRVFMRKPISPN